jgi:capsular polysaccharide transport system permease protein
LIFFFVSSFFLFIGLYFNFDCSVENLLDTILLIAWFVLFGASLGLLFAVIVSFYETFKKIVSLTSMPLMFTSGLFFSLKDLPTEVINILLYNPVLHFVEAIHASYINALDDRYVDYTYMALWTIIPLFCALFLYLKAERKIITT